MTAKSYFTQGMEYVFKFPTLTTDDANAFFAKGVELDLYADFHKAWMIEGFLAGQQLLKEVSKTSNTKKRKR